MVRLHRVRGDASISCVAQTIVNRVSAKFSLLLAGPQPAKPEGRIVGIHRPSSAPAHEGRAEAQTIGAILLLAGHSSHADDARFKR